jgi:type I restriction enzyme S subunit
VKRAPAWPVLPLSQLAEVRLGRQRSPKNHSGSQMRPYLRAANVGWNGLRLDDVKEMNFTDAEMSVYSLKPGDLLIGEASGSPGEVGKPALWNCELPECAFQNTLLRVRSQVMVPKFLLHYFRSIAQSGQFVEHSRGMGIHHLGRERLARWPTPNPPIGEQQRIVGVLEEHLSDLDGAADAVDRARRRTKILLQSRLLGLVLGDARDILARVDPVVLGASVAPPIPLPTGWVWNKWVQIGTSQNGRSFPSALYQSDGVRLLRPGNLGAAGALAWDPSATMHLPSAVAATYPGFEIKPEDIVMNLTAQSLKGDFLGRVCLVRDGDEALLNQRIARLRAERVSSRYALMVFRSMLFRRYVESLNTGSLIQHMFTKQVDAFWLPKPPGDEEPRLVHAWEALECGEARLSSALAATEQRSQALRKATLAAALNGQLTGSSFDTHIIEVLAEEEPS